MQKPYHKDQMVLKDPKWVLLYLTAVDPLETRPECIGFRWPDVHGYYNTEREAIQAANMLNGPYVKGVMPGYFVRKAYQRQYETE